MSRPEITGRKIASGHSTDPAEPTTEDLETYLGAKQVRRRYGGCSEMWIVRRLKDQSGFPRPVEIATRRYWKLSELVAWERRMAAETEAA
jgi:predicted DNA-binding transcriptional regulator AlpA